MSGWGSMNPNTQHQLWSQWTFKVYSSKRIPIEEIKLNAAKWLRMGFGSVGQARVYRDTTSFPSHVVIQARVEGPPAHDPDYVAKVKAEFTTFVQKGWGPVSWGEMVWVNRHC